MIELRDYQNEGVDDIRDCFKNNINSILYQLPTGGGKTVVFSYIAHSVTVKEKKVLILTDREELLKQAGGSLNNFGLNCYYIKAGTKFIDHRKNVYIAMSQTLRNRVKLPEWQRWIKEDIDLIIIDEAHIQEFNYLFESGVLKGKKVVGFTATPSRSGKMRQLGLDYERMIRGAEPKDLINKGYLLNCDTYEFESPNMSGVSINNSTGDYSGEQMFQRFDNLKTYQGLVKNYQKYTPGKKMLVFCCSVEHAIKTTIQLNEAGITAKFICSEKSEPKQVKEDGLFPSKNNQAERVKYEESLKKYNNFKDNYEKYSGTRKQVFDGFKHNEFTALVNVDIATKGYDEPSIEVVAIYRATNSLTLWLQMLGRGSRLWPNKDYFTVFDFGGNQKRLGSYDQNREWSLWHETGKEGNGVPPLKECGIKSTGGKITGSGQIKEGCKRLIIASMQICPFCGFKYPEKDEAKEVELVLASVIDDQGISLASKSFSSMTRYELIKYREIKKHKMPWLWRQLWLKGGEQELIECATEHRWSKNVLETAIKFCENIF